ncbi:MAG: spore coat protein CotJB [Acetivibrionales bacterium]
MDDAREKMLREVMALEFMLIELNLYLNTHPYDQRALMIFTNTAQRHKMVRENFERMYGPLTADASRSFPWPWIESPWPWEHQ